jgi:hypothetical protein
MEHQSLAIRTLSLRVCSFHIATSYIYLLLEKWYKLSIALPGSILNNAQSSELRTYLAGQIARSCAVFCVDEVIVFDETARMTDRLVLALNFKDNHCISVSWKHIIMGNGLARLAYLDKMLNAIFIWREFWSTLNAHNI